MSTPATPPATTPDASPSSQSPRNYNTISPSARALLLLKAHTTIPFAREAAKLIQAPEPFEPDFTNRQVGFWLRVVHFETRYWSINQLLPTAATNILELSSGFSFRGLALASERPVYYIDTDLPDVIETKKSLAAQLAAQNQMGYYELRPLNALDESAFNALIDSFPPGPITIVNEGLLMYLGIEEKRKLGRLIHDALRRRGGRWITADIYLKREMPRDPELTRGDTLQQFLDQHKVMDNMFNSFEEAKELFTAMGFTIDKEAEPDYASMSALPHFLASASPELLERMRQHPQKIHTTWRLKVG